MATLTPAGALDLLFKSLDIKFQQGYSQAEAFADKIALQTTSTSDSTKQVWMDLLPQVREWLGERQVKNAIAQLYELQNKTWELTIGIERKVIEDQQAQVYGPVVEMMGRQIATFKDKRLSTIVEQTGASALTFDGQDFFDTDHPTDTSGEVTGTQANLLTTTALTAANFGVAIAAGRNFKGRDNQPMGAFANPNGRVLMVPPALEQKGREILNGQYISVASGSTQNNVWQGAAGLVVNPYLTSASTWYLLDTSMPVKPFIWQERTSPEMEILTASSNPEVFMHDKYVYGMRMRGEAGYGLWFLAIKCTA